MAHFTRLLQTFAALLPITILYVCPIVITKMTDKSSVRFSIMSHNYMKTRWKSSPNLIAAGLMLLPLKIRLCTADLCRHIGYVQISSSINLAKVWYRGDDHTIFQPPPSARPSVRKKLRFSSFFFPKVKLSNSFSSTLFYDMYRRVREIFSPLEISDDEKWVDNLSLHMSQLLFHYS